MTKHNEQKQNVWKRLFFILLALNVVSFLIIILLVFWPASYSEPRQARTLDEQNGSEFIVRTTKQNLNELVNAYMDKFLQGTNHKYSVSLDKDVHLIGELPVFSTTVPLSIHLEPIVQDNGDIALKQKSISIGLLQLPNKKIMEYIKKYLTMPDWVNVHPDQEEIYVAVSEMDIKSNFQVSVEHFDLDANNLAFKIYVPYQTLGIDMIQSQ